MKVGIPRAMLWYKNEKFWTTFFTEIGVGYIVSPETDRAILARGEMLSIDETCLPVKLLLGHVDWLIGKCDYVFVPRMAFRHRLQMCTRFMAQTDLVANTFRERDVKLLFYSVGEDKPDTEQEAVYKMAKYLKIKKSVYKNAYQTAKQAQMFYERFRTERQHEKIETSEKLKILLVAHAYCVGDAYIGKPVIGMIKALGCEPIIAEYGDERDCIRASYTVSENMPWAYNRHLVGAVALYKEHVDGIVMLTAFPCGTDSMVNEYVIRTFKDTPIITLTVDAQDGSAGIETRLESFVDIIALRKERDHDA